MGHRIAALMALAIFATGCDFEALKVRNQWTVTYEGSVGWVHTPVSSHAKCIGFANDHLHHWQEFSCGRGCRDGYGGIAICEETYDHKADRT